MEEIKIQQESRKKMILSFRSVLQIPIFFTKSKNLVSFVLKRCMCLKHSFGYNEGEI